MGHMPTHGGGMSSALRQSGCIVPLTQVHRHSAWAGRAAKRAPSRVPRTRTCLMLPLSCQTAAVMGIQCGAAKIDRFSVDALVAANADLTDERAAVRRTVAAIRPC